MKYKNDIASKLTSTDKSLSLNLQTRPFAPIGSPQIDSTSEERDRYLPVKSSFAENILANKPTSSIPPLSLQPISRLKNPSERKARIQTKQADARTIALLPKKPKHNSKEIATERGTTLQAKPNMGEAIDSPLKKRSLQRQNSTGEKKLQELIAPEITHVVQQNVVTVRRSPLQDVVQRDDTLSTPTVGGYGGDTIEGSGNFLEFLDDAANALKTVRDPSKSSIEVGIAGSKAVGSLTGTVVAGLKANEIEKMTSCLEAMSEGFKIFDAGKEVWEAVRNVDFWNDTTMQTFENVAVVIGKLGDFIIGSTKIANAFVSAMEWTTGRLSSFAKWLPISELIMKCVKFMVSVKKWIFAFTSYKKLKVLQGTIDPAKQKQVGYLVDEQWSRLKNGAVPFASTGVDFASETAKYFPSLGINVAIVASLGTASKALPLGHKVLASGYDYARQGWRNFIKRCASSGMAEYFAAIDKADLNSFRDGLVNFVFNERNEAHGMLILESLGLGARVQTMGDTEAKEAIAEAVKDIK
ncbi:hypothetical protein [Pseudanabaena sp. 'Roaring Creek']|uniref:hypothetical protein n=1 Tax=Pseudanabaena sp. 'Roaring Creek' TaxID=1681830 RepID=UPI0006D81C19|nr:hypothetical protein [Pseudanabaena sp. 'Roaring Creek']